MKYLIVIVLVLLFVPFSISFFEELISFNFRGKNQLYFVSSTILFWIVFNRFVKQDNYYATLKHELIHNFFAVITFNKPVGLNINRYGGEFNFIGRSNVFISLSPYFFPGVSFLLLTLSIFGFKEQVYFHFILGLTTAFDLNTSYKDIHPYQTDFDFLGYKKSILFVFFFGLIFYGCILSFINGGRNRVCLFFYNTFELIVDFLMSF